MINTLPPIDIVMSIVINQLQKIDIDIKKNLIDHIGYRCISDQNYITIKNILLGSSQLLYEFLIDNRLVSIWKLDMPLRYKVRSIPCVELRAPKINNIHKEGREHIEVVISNLDEFNHISGKYITEGKGFHKNINRDLEIEFLNLNPNGGQLAIKFHEQSIEEVIKYEQQTSSNS